MISKNKKINITESVRALPITIPEKGCDLCPSGPLLTLQIETWCYKRDKPKDHPQSPAGNLATTGHLFRGEMGS